MLLAAPKGAGAAVIDLASSPNGVRLDGQARNHQAGSSLTLAGGHVTGNRRQDAIIGGVGGEDFAGTTYLLDVSADLSA